jgi:2OG-Fe(II) oxygenase superfamily
MPAAKKHGPLANSVLVDGQEVGKAGALDLGKLESLATPSPFGRGTQTVYDEGVRKALEITADRISGGLSGSLEDAFLDQARIAMAPKLRTFRCELHKLSIYKEGCFFKEHVDTLRGADHMASAVVCLPSKHEGGQLVVSDGKGEMVFDFAKESGDDTLLQWAVFYTDCKHRVEPVTSGTRVTLQFDLYLERGDKVWEVGDTLKTPQLPDGLRLPEGCEDASINEEALEKLLEAVKEWYDGSKESKVGLLLRHRYASTVTPKHLKGCDLALYNHLDPYFELVLVPVTIGLSVCPSFDCDDSYNISMSAQPFSAQDIRVLSGEEGQTTIEEHGLEKVVVVPGATSDRMDVLEYTDYIQCTGNPCLHAAPAAEASRCVHGACLLWVCRGRSR